MKNARSKSTPLSPGEDIRNVALAPSGNKQANFPCRELLECFYTWVVNSSRYILCNRLIGTFCIYFAGAPLGGSKGCF